MNGTNRLYWKISLTLLILLGILGVGYILITSYISGHYFQEVNQRLYGNIAQHLVQETKPLVNGKPDTSATHDIMHSMMVINPSSEVYLLDLEGKIIDYVVPYKKVKRDRVNLEPIQSFIETDGKEYILGDDPKSPGVQKVFSAAPIEENGKITGYAYIILASEEQEAVTQTLRNSYMLKLGANLFFLASAGALILGLIALWFLTKNLRQLISTAHRFQDGDYAARIPEDAKGDLVTLADTFNEMADQIEQHIEEIKSVEKLRQELIANVSHDLRTPLAIMRGYVETLLIKKDQLQPAEQEKYLNIIAGSTEKLTSLVSQLFEYTKLETNQITPQKEPFFAAELAQDIYGRFQILAQEKNIQLNLETPRDLPLVFADIGLVERVIQNLMDNAIKFTPEGGEVTIELAATNEGVEVRISDTGPGIPEEEQRFIFERYRQADRTQLNTKGAGLGLAIVKKILEIHDATIQVANRRQRGASFWFCLPEYQAG